MKTLFLLICLGLCLSASAQSGNITANLVIVEKAKRLLTLYSGNKPVKTYRIALGGNPEGHKQEEGDSRTPEGRYIIDAKNPNSSFHLSLHISYPDRSDIRSARRRKVSPGGAIMIHGTPGSLGALNSLGFYRDWTAGCIAVSDTEIEEIYAAIRTGTPIIIKP